MELIISEKFTTARELINGLTKKGKTFEKHFRGRVGYFKSSDMYVVPLSGHLLSLCDISDYLPEEQKWQLDILPFVPLSFKYKIKEDEEKYCANQFDILKKIARLSEVTKIVHFGDPDREGELIVRIILNEIGNKKPVSRMLTESILEEPIIEAYYNQKEISDYDFWYREGQARQYLDWLFGINLTRFLTVKTNKLFPVGRVLVPIVKFIFDRENKIKKFTKEYSFAVEGVLIKNDNPFYQLKHEELVFEVDDEVGAKSALDKMQNSFAKVLSISQNKVNKKPQKLFSGLKLQSLLNDKHKINMEESMAAMQFLYNNGYITYPRTETEYIMNNEKENVRKIIAALSKKGLPVSFHEKDSVFNDAKCQGHTALCVTLKSPDLTTLSETQALVYQTIYNRVLSNFCNEATVVESTKVSVKVNEYEYELIGEKVLQQGFMQFEPCYIRKELPPLSQDEQVKTEYQIANKETAPPKSVTVKELNEYLKNPYRDTIKNMSSDDEYYQMLKEGCSIGTVATISSIITKAIKDGYISLKGSTYSIETNGTELIQLLDKLGVNLYREKNVEFNKLLVKVKNNLITVEDVVAAAQNELVSTIKSGKEIEVEKHSQSYEKSDVFAKCPKCGKNVYENLKGFCCEEYGKGANACNVALWKNEKFFEWKGKKLSAVTAKALLTKGKVSLKGLKKQDGGTYDAVISVSFDKQYPTFAVNFPKK